MTDPADVQRELLLKEQLRAEMDAMQAEIESLRGSNYSGELITIVHECGPHFCRTRKYDANGNEILSPPRDPSARRIKVRMPSSGKPTEFEIS
jgi:hypothetical protein